MPAPIRIADPDDPRVAAYRDIRERDLVGRQGLFVAEGKVVLNVLLEAQGFEVSSILILENRFSGLTEILAKTPAATPVYIAEASVMDAIAGFPIHRGILAIGHRTQTRDSTQLITTLPDRALVLVPVGIANHDNLGAIFRNAAAFGVHAVLLDPTCCDPLYRKAIRVSVGGVFRTAYASFGAVDSLIADLDRANVRMVALSPKSRTDLRDIRSVGPTALFLGTEGEGLPRSLLDKVETARIPMASGFDSLNVATASAIALYHLADSRLSAR